ncbi:uncharacterized protein LOC110434333 isoform X2 [Sorghum bicolor]|uniref:uncharacterized protein LOC110434333 isoform X2 n=1 Tax=Sorghum bicolor TaxID=4558 RepID=UPI000B4241D9|nr:uncharacterized protein LOC110434333 isoform X2 [Sorghum bicolor]|eukprot:XP_021313869.1 uncharacterized protein LOC110434333 isoform X2 [Sorghum bicolor]
MSLEDSFKKRIAKCRREHDIIYKQLPVLLEKLEILFPTGKKMESSDPEKVAPLKPLTPAEIGVHYKDLEETIKGFLSDLDEAEKETGGTSQAAATPPSVEDE